MDIKINGEMQKVPTGINTLLDLFDYLALKPQGRIVEVNGELFRPEVFEKTILVSGCEIEIIQFMGGG